MSISIKNVKNRLHKRNKNWLAIVCGETGSGKSYTALKIAKAIDPSFNIDRVVFTVKEFMELVTSKKIKRGMVIVFDEAGVQIASREWYSLRNKSINYVLQTFRHQNLGVIFTTPTFDFIDKQTRKLFHAYIETQKINKKHKYVLVKWLNLQPNPKYDKTYFKYQRTSKDGTYKINRVKIYKPEKDLITEYERKRRKYTTKLKNEVLAGISRVEEPQEEILTRQQIIDRICNSYKKYIKEYKGRRFIDHKLIVGDFDQTDREAKIIKAKVEQKLNI